MRLTAGVNMQCCAHLTIASCICLTSTLMIRPARAQSVVDGTFAVHSGFEGADPGVGAIAWQRARTRLAVGAEWLTDDTRREAIGLSALIELERSGSFGAEVRYRRWLYPWLGAYAAVTSILQPESLLGVSGGATGALPLGPRAALFAELSVSAFPLGTDLPHDEAVLIWGSLGVGVRLRF